MQKILIEIKHQNLTFSYCDYNSTEGNFTSITEDGINHITTTLEYIEKKLELFTLYITRSINENEIIYLNIDDYNLASIAFKLTNEKNFESIIFTEEATLPKDLYTLIFENKTKTKSIACYSMTKEMFESFSGNNIKVSLQKVDFLINKLMEKNEFKTYSDIEDAYEINFNFKPDIYDLEDFENFLIINKNLEAINIKEYHEGLEKQIMSILIKNKRCGTTINIHENNEDIIKYLPHLKQLKKQCKKCCNLKFIYSPKYKFKIIKKQIKNILIFVFISLLVIMSTYIIFELINKN